MQWTSDPRFKASRNVYFSFIHSDVSKLKESILNWDPKLVAGYKSHPKVVDKTASSLTEASIQSGGQAEQAPSDLAVEESMLELDASAFMQTQSSSTTATLSITHLGACIFMVYTMLQLLW